MQELSCPKCGEVFQVDETGYDQLHVRYVTRCFQGNWNAVKRE